MTSEYQQYGIGLGDGLRRSIGFAKNSWNPQYLNNMLVWYDAADADTITSLSGSVSQWADKSGNDNHATNTSAANQPTIGDYMLNGENTISFSDTRWLELTTDLQSVVRTAVFLQRWDNPVITGSICFVLGTIDSPPDWHSSTGEEADNRRLLSTNFSSSEVLNGDKYENGVKAPPGDPLHRNADPTIVVIHTTGPTSVGYLSRDRDFTNRGMVGSLAEVLLFSTVLSETNRKLLTAYLGRKWAVTVNQ